MRKLELQGRKFGRLTVMMQALSIDKKVRWVCLCECGKVCKVVTDKLKSGNTVSCGCKRRKHGHSYAGGKIETPEYNSWSCMKARCLNPRASGYQRYGGRGIEVCERWMNFSNFLTDMGLKPTPRHTIDRINNDGNYELGNCRWATYKEQNAYRIGCKASVETRRRMSEAHKIRWRELKFG